MKYFKVFNTENEYHAYVQGDDFIAPNISTLYDCTKTWILEGREVIHVTGVTLNKSSISIVKDKTFKLEATVTPNDAADKSVTWSSSNENVATVDSNGVVSGVASGDAAITVTTVDGGFTAQCSISVSNHDYSEEYLSFTALEDATFTFTKATQYSIDGGDTWVALPSNTSTPTISAGNKIYWKASLSGSTSVGTFSSTGEYNACGNPMSLLYNDDFVGKTTMGQNNFKELFKNNTKLISISDLSLPATTLANGCYYNMFSGCTSLTDTVAELPATTMANECYRGMFANCSSLTTISFTLPAMVMADGCYRAMFGNCDALTDIPELPATTLAASGYSFMFDGCDGLTDLSSHTLSATTLAEHCYHSMFARCPNLTAAPILPAETLVNSCYYYMFGDSSKLSYIKCLATDISATNSTYNWVWGVASSGTFVKNAAATWTKGNSGIPTNWTVEDYGDVSVTGVTLSPSSITINKDATHILIATVLPNNATNKSITWASSDTTIATVDSNGVVSGVANGDVTITVTTVDGGFTAQCSVSVSEDAPHDYSLDYFTIESLENSNAIKMQRSKTPNNPTLEYSLDSGSTWTSVQITGIVTFATINSGQTIIFKGNNTKFAKAWDNYNYFNATKQFKVYGNVMSLLNGDNFRENSEFANNSTHNFAGLLRTTYIVDASNLILPALTCNQDCYNGMFRGATNLQHGPQMLATTVSGSGCCSSMFEECINLEEAIEINFTNLSEECCQRMFCMSRSTKLTTPKMTKSPILRCATAATNCYKEMFKGNGNLNEITCLLQNPGGGTTNWVQYAGAATGTFYKNPSASWGQGGNDNVPSGWNIVDYVE